MDQEQCDLYAKDLLTMGWRVGQLRVVKSVEQAGLLMALKMADEVEGLGQTGSSTLFGDRQELRWSHFKALPSDMMLGVLRNQVVPFMAALDDPRFGPALRDVELLISSPELLVKMVKAIDSLSVSEMASQDGNVFERLLYRLRASGWREGHIVPPQVARLIVALVNPMGGERVLDLWAGGGSVLSSASMQVESAPSSSSIAGKPTLEAYDPDPTMVNIARLNLLLNGATNVNVRRVQPLTMEFDPSSQFDVVISVPPFGYNLVDKNLDLTLGLRSSKGDLSFANLAMSALKPGGRGALLVPKKVLFGDSQTHRAIRQILVEGTRIDAIVTLPEGVFWPISAVEGAIILITKGETTSEVRFYEVAGEALGKPGQNAVSIEGEANEVVNAIRGTPGPKCQPLVVPLSSIVQNEFSLSVERYKEAKPKAELGEPVELLDRAMGAQREVYNELRELRRLI